MQPSLLKVNRERLLKTLHVSSSVGPSENGGMNRLALTESDKEIRDIFVKWLSDEGLDVRIDDFGNIYGRRKGRFKDRPPVVIGSHLDTQPRGGKYDGVLGVLCALEVVRVLNEHQIETDYPIEIVNFTNEEGARFSPPMLGSGGAVGALDKDFIYNILDSDGISFREALEAINYVGDEANRIKKAKNFIELHIEQGPILANEGKTIGIVKGIQGYKWMTVKVTGAMNHAGPTPMEHRKDALVATAKMLVKVNEITNDFNGLKTTVGILNVTPNVTNVIPGHVEFTIDARHEENDTRIRAIQELEEQLYKIASENKVELAITTDFETETVPFAPTVIEAITESVQELEYSSKSFYSGAGHDAKYMADIAETGMIFLPSINGISHNEQELTLDDDIEKGANVLLHVVRKLTAAI